GAYLVAVTVTGSDSSVVSGAQVYQVGQYQYTWSVILNGSPYVLPPGTEVGDPDFAFAPALNGLYGVGLSVSSAAGGTSSTSVYFVVTGAPPSAGIVGAPARGQEGTPIKLGAAAGSGLSGTLTYDWAVHLNGNTTPVVVENNDATGFLSF